MKAMAEVVHHFGAALERVQIDATMAVERADQTVEKENSRGLLDVEAGPHQKIEEPARRPSGYRDYPPTVLKRLRFIQRAKELGFSLAEVGDLLSLRVDRNRSCADVFEVAQTKISEIDGKVEELERMRGALVRLSAECSGEGPTGDCPILEALEGDGAP